MSGDNDARYEISYYEDQEDGEAGRLMGYNSDFTRLRDATCVARKDGLTHHAWITRHKPNADDSGEIVWSRKPLAPKDECTAIRWLIDAIKGGDKKRMNQVVRACKIVAGAALSVFFRTSK